MAENEVRIKITVNDADASKRLQGFGQRLKEMGERVNFIGSRFTAMFTAPVVGGLYALAKSGSESAKVVNDLQQQITDAVKEGNTDKVKELNAEMAALPETTRRAARAWNEMQSALKPAADELDETKVILAEALVPLIRELAPLLTDAARGIRDMAQRFSDLPAGAQKTIIGIVGLGAAIGPVMLIVGQFMGMIGSAAQLLGAAGIGTGAAGAAGAAAGGAGLAGAAATAGTAVTGFGAAVGAALAPIGLLVAAVLLLKQVLKDFGPQAATTARQLLLLASLKTGLIDKQRFADLSNYYGITGRAGGGQMLPGRSYLVGETRPEVVNMGPNGAYVNPIGGGSRGGGGATLIFEYKPLLSTASQDEIERLGRIVRDAARRSS